jgi:hypothetical protein
MAIRPTITQTNFDSVLQPAQPARPAQLIIRLKVELVPHDPGAPQPLFGHTNHNAVLTRIGGQVSHGVVKDADGRAFRCQSWMEPEFNAFAIKFKKMVELSWNNQLFLLPPDDSNSMTDGLYREFISSPDVPAHVECRLDIQIVDPFHLGGKTPHANITAVRLQNPEGGQFRSAAYLISNEDVEFRPTSGRIIQVTAAHEIGHWLGRPVDNARPERYMPHVDPDYGRTLSKRMALMGIGQLVTNFEAAPWLERIRRHTGVLFGWDIVHRVHFNAGRIPVSGRQHQLVQQPISRP